MAELERLIEDLQSDDPGKRFQACNGLFYAQSIPESAIEALRKTTQDSDPIVADAAQHALDIHIPESTTIPQNQLEDGKSSTTMTNFFGGMALMVWAGIVAGICNFIYSNSFLDGNHWMISVFYCTPIAFLTAFFIFGFFFFFSKRISPNSHIGLGKLVILSTVSGVISAIAWQLISLLFD